MKSRASEEFVVALCVFGRFSLGIPSSFSIGGSGLPEKPDRYLSWEFGVACSLSGNSGEYWPHGGPGVCRNRVRSGRDGLATRVPHLISQVRRWVIVQGGRPEWPPKSTRPPKTCQSVAPPNRPVKRKVRRSYAGIFPTRRRRWPTRSSGSKTDEFNAPR
jgi:hypothetical protein